MYANLTLHLKVTDRAALHRAAMLQATIGGGGMSAKEARELLGTARRPDVSACLVMLLDPGVSPPGIQINDSTCETYL